MAIDAKGAARANALVLLDAEPASLVGLDSVPLVADDSCLLVTVDSKLARPERPADVVRSHSAEPSMSEVLATAASRGAAWVIMRRDVAPPERLLSELLLGAGKVADENLPGFGVLLTTAQATPVRRILAVIHPADRPVSGLLSYCAEVVAERSGAVIDMLVLGTPGTELSAEAEDNLVIAREQELYEEARLSAAEAGLEVNWITVGEVSDPWVVILDHLGRAQYDLVIDDLGDVAIGSALRSGISLEQALGPGGVGEIPLLLLRNTELPILLVVDGIRLGMLSSRLLRLGAAAAAALAVMGGGIAHAHTGANPAGRPEDTASAQAASALNQLKLTADQTKRQAQRRAKVEAASRKASKTTVKFPKVKPPKGGARKADVTKAKAETKSAAKEVKAASHHLRTAKTSAAKSHTALTASQKHAASATRNLTAAQEHYTEVAAAASQVSLERSGIAAVLPGGASQEDVSAANELVATAAAELTSLTEAGVSAAEDLAAAQTKNAKANAVVADAQSEVAETKAAYQQARATTAVYQASYDDYLDSLRQTPVRSGAYHLTARFGQGGGHWSSGHHTGLDFAAPVGTNVYAAASGTVVKSGWGGAYGNHVEIDVGGGVVITYSHLSVNKVKVGDKVSAGEHIGDVGMTGNTTGPHLHFEVKVNGQFRDPFTWLRL